MVKSRDREMAARLATPVCYSDTFIGAFTGFGAIWSLMALAVDRCVVITRSMPVQHPTDKMIAYFVTATIWIVALAFAIMPFLGFGRYSIEGSKIACSVINFTKSFSNMLYNILIQVLYFFIPIICMICCYSIIFIKVRTHERQYFNVKQSGQVDDSSFRRMRKSRKLERNEMKTARAGLILISVFCLSWTPYSIVSWIGLLGNRYTLTPLAVALPAVFAKMSTILNPLLYALLLRSFKLKLRLLYKQHFQLTRTFNVASERTNVEIISNLDRHRRQAADTTRRKNLNSL
ncbi:lateral eye opsin-like [Mercenaria mercenaria]|uniref:lateral eye opsin-like n=1 Tax=Mercenaria mercenaria TaxID=6596 RepID=UPI00234F0F0C|nr:lateral eye opsin-like [Mercenaria mercenaria]